MKSGDVYLPESDEYLESIEEEYDWYCWEEEDWSENRCFYENDLEHLEELPSKEKIHAN
jgi:hypothetical protein